eukprot:scaffold163903_cov65-Attheya_sp.AAC.1
MSILLFYGCETLVVSANERGQCDTIGLTGEYNGPLRTCEIFSANDSTGLGQFDYPHGDSPVLYNAPSGSLTFGHANDAVTIDEGLYYDASNPMSHGIAQHWPCTTGPTYTPETGATPWFPTGDSRTGLPFLLYPVDTPDCTRVWLPLDDGEVVALNIAFPQIAPSEDLSKSLTRKRQSSGFASRA